MSNKSLQNGLIEFLEVLVDNHKLPEGEDAVTLTQTVIHEGKTTTFVVAIYEQLKEADRE